MVVVVGAVAIGGVTWRSVGYGTEKTNNILDINTDNTSLTNSTDDNSSLSYTKSVDTNSTTKNNE